MTFSKCNQLWHLNPPCNQFQRRLRLGNVFFSHVGKISKKLWLLISLIQQKIKVFNFSRAPLELRNFIEQSCGKNSRGSSAKYFELPAEISQIFALNSKQEFNIKQSDPPPQPRLIHHSSCISCSAKAGSYLCGKLMKSIIEKKNKGFALMCILLNFSKPNIIERASQYI